MGDQVQPAGCSGPDRHLGVAFGIAIVISLVAGLFILSVAIYQYTQWRAEKNRVPRIRAILVLDANRHPIEGAQIRMEGSSFRPIVPLLSFVLQRGVWHPHWTSEFEMTGKDGTVRFSYKSDSAHIAELRIDGWSTKQFGNWWVQRDGTLYPADAYLIPEPRRNGVEEKDTVIVMKRPRENGAINQRQPIGSETNRASASARTGG